MPRISKLLPLLVFVLFLQDSHAGDDWGSSHNLLIKADINEDWFFLSRSNLAFRRDNEQLFLGYTGASLGYQLNEKWSTRVGFRQAYFKIGEEWREEQRPMLEAYYADFFDGFRFTSRTRVEFRYIDWNDDDTRMRQEFTLTAPWELTPLKMKPYIANETFYSMRKEWIEANWFDIGLSFFPWERTKLKFGYRFNRLRIQSDFSNRHTLVTGVNLFF